MSSSTKLQSQSNGNGLAGEPLINDVAEMAKLYEERDTCGAVYKPTTGQVDIRQASKYVSLSKEELERYVDDPFWKKLRYVCLFLFWFAWIGMFAAAILIVLMSPKCPPKPERHWWQKKICYQIWSRSFRDSNGDGVGDFNGITEKMSLLDTTLKASAIWPVPVLKSTSGNGYDILDFKNVDPALGTLEDYENLIKAAHKQGLFVVMDLPLATVSIEHEWFKKSVEKSGDFENYFTWSSTNPGRSDYSEVTGRGFYRNWGPGARSKFALLNWDNDSVRSAMQDVAKFWLDKGIDGFYLAEIHLISTLPDGTPNWESIHSHVKQLTTYMRSVSAGRKILTFTSYFGYEAERNISKNEFKSSVKLLSDVDYVINNELVMTNSSCGAACFYDHLSQVISFHSSTNASWPMWELGHPYVSRAASRLGGRDQSQLAMMLLLTLPGSINVYYGDEIGMRDSDAANVSKINARRGAMQWNSEKNAGASDAEKISIPPNSDYVEVNFKNQQTSDSSLKMFKRLAVLRRSEDAFLYGDIVLGPKTDDLLIVRAFSNHSTTDYLTLLNFGAEKIFDLVSKASPYHMNVTEKEASVVTTSLNLASTKVYKDRQPINLSSVRLGQHQGIVIKLKAKK